MSLQFDDGYIVKSTRYQNFKDGNVRNPNLKISTFIDKTSEVGINKQGLKMWIKEYRGAFDVDVEDESGERLRGNTAGDGSASHEARVGRSTGRVLCAAFRADQNAGRWRAADRVGEDEAEHGQPRLTLDAGPAGPRATHG